MSEEMKIRIIYILVMIVPVIVYFCIGSVLIKSFNKTPDDPSYTEKKKGRGLVNVLKKLAVTVVAFGVVILGLKLLVKMHDDSTAKEQAVIAEYEALNENNVDPANGKTILTQAFLMKEYKLYSLNEHGWAKYESTIYKGVFLLLLFSLGGESCIGYAILFYHQKKKINILSIVASVLLIPTVIYGFRVIDNKVVSKGLPDPAKAKVTVRSVTVKSRHEDVRHDEETGDSYKYYVTIDYGDGSGPVKRKVGYDWYSTAEEPGTYLIGQAEENGNVIEFKLYSMKEYETE